jgi:hypothetical protein
MMFSFHQLVPFLHTGKHDRSLKLIDGVYEFVIQGCGVLREVCKSLAALDAYVLDGAVQDQIEGAAHTRHCTLLFKDRRTEESCSRISCLCPTRRS